MKAPPTGTSRTSHRVVVAMTDGTRKRGYVYNFSPNAPTFYLFPTESADSKFAALVELKGAKAIFFVRSHQGDKAYREARRKAPVDLRKFRVRGHKMKITFSDGEEMFASTENYNPTRLGFFVYPLDPGSNNLRVFVVNENVRQVTTGAALQSSSSPPVVQERIVRQSAPAPSPAAPPPPSGAPEPPPHPLPVAFPDTCTVPLAARVEAVLRIIAGQSAADVSEETGIPTGVLTHWSHLFLQHGRAGLSGAAPEGTGGSSDLVRELAARVCALEDELDRLRGGAPRRK